MRIEWNGKKLTKKRALFLCWKLWEWLGENPGKEKFEWPHWERNGGRVKHMGADCPCCEFVPENEHEEDICEECPLYEFWDISGAESLSGEPCLNDSSQFYKWMYEGRNPEYARCIAAAAKRRYEKL